MAYKRRSYYCLLLKLSKHQKGAHKFVSRGNRVTMPNDDYFDALEFR